MRMNHVMLLHYHHHHPHPLPTTATPNLDKNSTAKKSHHPETTTTTTITTRLLGKKNGIRPKHHPNIEIISSCMTGSGS
jgi:hypothetical protein